MTRDDIQKLKNRAATGDAIIAEIYSLTAAIAVMSKDVDYESITISRPTAVATDVVIKYKPRGGDEVVISDGSPASSQSTLIKQGIIDLFKSGLERSNNALNSL